MAAAFFGCVVGSDCHCRGQQRDGQLGLRGEQLGDHVQTLKVLAQLALGAGNEETPRVCLILSS